LNELPKSTLEACFGPCLYRGGGYIQRMVIVATRLAVNGVLETRLSWDALLNLNYNWVDVDKDNTFEQAYSQFIVKLRRKFCL